MPSPLVSLALAVKNGLPHLRSAIEAVQRQTYRRFELVVQDGGSIDGSLEYLQSAAARMPACRIESEPDAGVGQAYNRALARCSGELVCFIASDEQLEDDALERAVGWWSQRTDAVYVNGSVRLVDGAGAVTQVFDSPHFDLLGHLRCDVVLAFAGLLNVKAIGGDLYYDEKLRTCPDYDFWIRLGSRFAPEQFFVAPEVFKTARADRASMSYRAEEFPQFCADKLFVLNRFLDGQPAVPLIDEVRRTSSAGILLWAAEQVANLEGASARFIQMCDRAASFDPWSPRLRKLQAAVGTRLATGGQ
jgi:glycosyltransferase involved in cell wall biosynthesis